MANTKKSSFVIVYHRQPYDEVMEGGRVVYKENKSPNGIVPALKGFFSTAEDAVWVAWKQAPAAGKPMFERTVHIKDSYGEYDVVRLPLKAEQVKAFYHVTSKEALWPILHSFPDKFNYGPVDWENFREVNRLFAEAACEQAKDDAFIWVHDYNLWLVPHYVRQIKPKARIAMFHHTPFPVDEFQFGEAQKVAGMIDTFCRALFGNFVILTQESRQAQALQMMGQQQLGRVGHDRPPDRSAM